MKISLFWIIQIIIVLLGGVCWMLALLMGAIWTSEVILICVIPTIICIFAVTVNTILYFSIKNIMGDIK